MDSTNILETWNLSTFYLSTAVLEVGPNPIGVNTFFQATSSLGIGHYASTETIDVNAYAYTIEDTNVGKILSSLKINATRAQGVFFGDGSLLRGVNYPESIQTAILSTGSLVVDKTNFSAAIASSGIITDVFVTNSTLKIGDFSIFGNSASFVGKPMSNYLFTDTNIVALNNLYAYGDTAGQVVKQVVVNPNIIPNPGSNYKLAIGGTFHVNQIISPELLLEIQTYYGNVITAGDIGLLSANTLFVESGIIGSGNGTFFIPDGVTPIRFSTNIVQPYNSTLAFNSTLFANRELRKVGINNLNPTYTLDVKSNAKFYKEVIGSVSTVIDTTLFVNQRPSSLWFATASILIASVDEGETWAPFQGSAPLPGTATGGITYDGGPLILAGTDLQAPKLWMMGGESLIQFYSESFGFWQTAFTQGNVIFPSNVNSIEYNGQRWVAVGENPPSNAPSLYPPILWSDTGLFWNAPTFGGFESDSVSETYGGCSIAWNGSLWVAVGRGANQKNSIVFSPDGKTWSNTNTNGFSGIGRGVVWTGTNWVATGDNGNSMSSFMVSTDGSNWTGIGGYGFESSFGYAGGNGIASDGNIVVAVGTQNPSFFNASIQYSLDKGYTWSNALGDLFTAEGDFGKSVVWNGSYWLAGGLSGLRKSYDGIVWFQPPGSPPVSFIGLAYSSNAQPVLQIGASNYTSTFRSTITTMNVACMGNDLTNNCLRYSEDGSNWNYALSGYFDGVARAAAYNGSNLWVAAGNQMNFQSYYLYSSNGKNWTPTNLFNFFTGEGTAVAYGGGYWVAGADNQGLGGGTLWYSSNGIDFQSAFPGFVQATWGVAYGAGKFVAVGDDLLAGPTIRYTTTSVPDTWTTTGVTNAFDSNGNAVAYGNGRWVACGGDSSGYTIKYSADGSNWLNATGVFETEGLGVDYNGTNMWVAVGDNPGASAVSNILYSTDGIAWQNAVSGAFTSVGYAVRYNQALGLWMAAGNDGTTTGSLKYSGDGMNWSDAIGAANNAGLGLGAGSNVHIFETKTINQLRFYNTPGTNALTRDTTPSISYTSTSLTFLNTLTVDQNKNIGIQENSLSYRSTLSVNSLASVSTFVSTNTVQAAAFYLRFANV